MKFKNKTTGFTLIELLVVISIVAVLSGVIFQSLNSAKMRARNAQRLASVDQIAKGFQVATTGTNNSMPETDLALNSGWQCLGKKSCWGDFFSGVTNPLPDTVTPILVMGMSSSPAVDSYFSDGQTGDAVVYYGSKTTAPTLLDELENNLTPTPGAYLAWIWGSVPDQR